MQLSQPDNVTKEARRPTELAGVPLQVSAWLDVLRFGAALAVVADHASLPEFNAGARNREVWGFIAVPVFFLLSGFVIRNVAATRDSSLSQFLSDRATRLYSVVLPALLLSALLCRISLHVDRARVLAHWSGSTHQPIARLLVCVLFLHESWGLDVTPFNDVPFWSMAYEWWYYVLFGCVLYLRGRTRLLAIAAAALVAGPQILWLSAVWICGCAVHDLYQRWRGSRVAHACALAAGLMAALTLPLHAVPRLVMWFAALPNPLALLSLPVKHATMLALGAGLVSAPLLLITLLLADALPPAKGAASMLLRRLGSGSFPLYLGHYPLLMLAAVFGWLSPARPLHNAAVVATLCLVLVAAAPLCDRLKLGMRHMLVPRSR